MKKYYSSPKHNPDSESYDPTLVIKRPVLTENDEINSLHNEVFELKKKLARYEHNDASTKTQPNETGDLSKSAATTVGPLTAGDAHKQIDISDINTGDINSGDINSGDINSGGGLKFVEVPATEKSSSGGVISKSKRAGVNRAAAKAPAKGKGKGVSAAKNTKGSAGKKS